MGSGSGSSTPKESASKGRGVCRLCKNEATLLNSHVLSEFLYQPTYQHFDPDAPKKKRMLSVPADPDEKLEWLQKGIREPLLCEVCEQHLNRIGERYASGVLKQMDDLDIRAGESRSTISGVEYAAFKLFVMTQLWRAGVASGERWEKVRLGPQEEKLRVMLLNEDPGTPNQYACAITKVPASLGPLSRTVVPPGVAKYGGHHIYEFVARGHSWTYVASDRFKGFKEPDLFLSEQGDLPILSDATGSLDLRAGMLIRQMWKQRRAREGKDA